MSCLCTCSHITTSLFPSKISDSISEHDGHKRVIYVLSKADLVPRDSLKAWLRYIRKTGEAAIAFRLVNCEVEFYGDNQTYVLSLLFFIQIFHCGAKV